MVVDDVVDDALFDTVVVEDVVDVDKDSFLQLQLLLV